LKTERHTSGEGLQYELVMTDSKAIYVITHSHQPSAVVRTQKHFYQLLILFKIWRTEVDRCLPGLNNYHT